MSARRHLRLRPSDLAAARRSLEGPAYLTSSDSELPDLLADPRGQVNIRLRGTISAVADRLKTVFYPTPDVAVDKFVLNMRGGNRGLLGNSENLCQRKRFAFLDLKAQNSRRMPASLALSPRGLC